MMTSLTAGRHVKSLDEACDAPLFTHWTTPCNFFPLWDAASPPPAVYMDILCQARRCIFPAAEQKTVTESDKAIK